MKNKTKIILLGTGTPNAEIDKFGPGTAILINDQPYIVDCGAGIIRRIQAAYNSGHEGMQIKNINKLFLTHLHSDHTVGFPDIIFSPWVLEREVALDVIGPTGTKEMTDCILKAYKHDIKVRINGLEPINKTGYEVKVHEINDKDKPVYKDENVEVYSFRQCHGPWRAYGYRFITPDKTIVISGDCAARKNLEVYRNCDVLIHEVYSSEGFKKREESWQKYHSRMHTSSVQLAEIASNVKPGLLVLYHQLYFGKSDEFMLSEITDRYSGRVISGKDLLVIE